MAQVCNDNVINNVVFVFWIMCWFCYGILAKIVEEPGRIFKLNLYFIGKKYGVESKNTI